ncbi:UTP--glucose-1-phosphate uridylyltransferase GalU [Hyphococcus sp.]|uniref:UTP--glucose-1-phosphate uridylyltransferase GalU n=1 Tax=Hyphococcus sp. TaxID=2038636 RepID=UPI003CCBDB0B
MKSVRKVVIPVAGHGTRVLPATKSIPKELLPLVDRPLIDYVVNEAFDAGIDHAVLVTGRNKGAIEDYFDHAFELEAGLEGKKKTDILNDVRNTIPKAGALSYTRQQAPLGLGHAIWCARQIVGAEPFAVSLPDVVMDGNTGCLAQMVEHYKKTGGNIIAVERVAPEETNKYGIVAPKGEAVGALFEMSGMIEKPAPGQAPSNLAITGRYILQPEIFDLLEKTPRGAGGEIQLTDAMDALMKEQSFYAFIYEGVSHDCGDKLGWLKANIALGLKRPEFASKLKDFLDDIS